MNNYKFLTTLVFSFTFINFPNTICMYKVLGKTIKSTMARAVEIEEELREAENELIISTRAAEEAGEDLEIVIENGKNTEEVLSTVRAVVIYAWTIAILEVEIEVGKEAVRDLERDIATAKGAKANLKDVMTDLEERSLLGEAMAVGADEVIITCLEEAIDAGKEEIANLETGINRAQETRINLETSIGTAEMAISEVIVTERGETIRRTSVPELLGQMEARATPLRFEKTYGLRCSINCANNSLKNLVVFFPCSHLIHKQCLINYGQSGTFRGKCPLCNTTIEGLEEIKKVPALLEKIKMLILQKRRKKTKRRKRTASHDPSQDDDNEDDQDDDTQQKRKRKRKATKDETEPQRKRRRR